jgi:putative MATE family efflux protein
MSAVSEQRLSAIDLSGHSNRAVWQIAWPVMLTQALYTSLNLVDMFWVGKLGRAAVAAVALCGSVLGVLFSLGQLFTVAAMATSSRAAGANSRAGVQESLRHSLLLSVLVAVPLALFGFVLSGQLLGVFRAAADVVAAGVPYLRVVFLGLPGFFFGMVAYSVFQALGDTRTPMFITLGTNVANAALDPVLIFGWCGAPRLGVTGAALATVGCQSLGLLVMLAVLRRRGLLRVRGRIRFSAFRTLAGIGVPAGLSAVTRPLTGMVMFGLVTGFGTAATAAFGIGLRALEVMYIYLAGLGSAGEVLVGQSLGRGEPVLAERASRRVTLIALLLQAIVLPLLFLAAGRVVGVFSSDADVVRTGTLYLRVLAPALAALALVVGWGSAQRGAGATVLPMVAALVSNWLVKLPLAWVLARLTGLGLAGVWIGIGASLVVEALLLGVGYFRRGWLRREVRWVS